MSQTPKDREDRAALADYGEAWGRLMTDVRHGESWSGREANCMFINNGGGRFVDASQSGGFDYKDDARAMAICDWDRDGDLDLWMRNRTAPRLRLMRNRGVGGGRSVMLKLEGVECNRDAIGAVVEMSVAGAPPLVRSVRAGEMFLSQSSKWLHFGLGRDGVVEAVTVRWPGGAAERFEGVGERGRFGLRQGSGEASAWAGPGAVDLGVAAAPLPLGQGPRGRIILPTAAPVPEIRYRDKAAKMQTLRPTGEGRLVMVWESGCPDCEHDLKAQAESTTPLDVIALAADRIESAGAAYDTIDRTGFAGEWGFIDPGSLDALWKWGAALFDRVPEPGVPLSLLLDGRGNCVAIYRGRTTPDSVAEDARQWLGIDPITRWHLAPALAGTWFTNPIPEAFVRQRLE